MKIENDALAVSTTTNETIADAPSTLEAHQSAPKTGFKASLRSHLQTHDQGMVSEEELFSALVSTQVEEVGGAEAIEKYKQSFQNKAERRSGSGFIEYEEITKRALSSMVENQTLSEAEANDIYAKAFAAAQLDDNSSYLFDHRGDSNDPTKAVRSQDEALTKASTFIKNYQEGDALARPVTENTPGKAAILRDPTIVASKETSSSAEAEKVDGSNKVVASGAQSTKNLSGLLYKPESESDGSLVILSPYSLTGSIDSVNLARKDGSLVEEGRYTGVHNGNREHFRFSKPGAEYPLGIEIEITLDNGEILTIPVDDPTERLER